MIYIVHVDLHGVAFISTAVLCKIPIFYDSLIYRRTCVGSGITATFGHKQKQHRSLDSTSNRYRGRLLDAVRSNLLQVQCKFLLGFGGGNPCHSFYLR